MKVVGIDPGTAACGYGIVQHNGGRLRAVDHGWWTTPANERPELRLKTIFEGVEDLIAKAIADESDLPHDAIAPKALAAAIVTTLLALQEGFAEHGPSDHPDFFGGASKMLGAALAALPARSGTADR